MLVALGAFYYRGRVVENQVIADLQTPGGVIDQLTDFYAQNGSWNSVEPYLFQRITNPIIGPDRSLALSLVDDNDRILAGFRTGQFMDGNALKDAIPVRVNGQVEGYVVLTQMDFRPPQSQSGLLLQPIITLLLIVATLGGLLSIVATTIVGRRLTAPLSQLAEAARAIGAHDLSKRVKVEGTFEAQALAEAFNEMAQQLEQSEKLRSNMVADVAHELRTPLSVLQGNLRAILDDVYPLTKEEVSKLYDHTRSLGKLVNDLRELSQAEAHQLPLSYQHIDLCSFIETQVAAFLPNAEAEGVHLHVKLPPELPPIEADRARLAQILGNLVMNAITHTPKGGDITIAGSSTPQAVTLTIHDTGEGIPSASLPYVFDHFYRVDASRSRDSGGAGLGLAIVKALVEAHKGRISVSSAGVAGEGTTFTVVLPVNSTNEFSSET